MDSRKSRSAALFLITNLVLFSVASSCYVCNHPNNPPVPKPNPNPSNNNSNIKGKCPRDALKLGVCAKLLGDNIGTVIGTPPDPQCCSVLGGLLDLEAAICLCTALKANVLGININIPISLSLLINTCGKNLPSDFICA